jgi:hypothetical protein
MMQVDVLFARNFTEAAIDAADNYLRTMESYLASAKDADLARIWTALAELRLSDEDERGEYDLAMQEHQPMFDMFLPTYFRYSFIALLLLILENRLAVLCYAAKEVRQASSDPPRPRRDILKEYKEYVTKQLGIDKLGWDDILLISRLRNCLVHASGKVKDCDRQSLNQLRTRAPGLHISSDLGYYKSQSQPLFFESDVVVLEPEFCQYAVRAIRTFLAQFCDSIPLDKFGVDIQG